MRKQYPQGPANRYASLADIVSKVYSFAGKRKKWEDFVPLPKIFYTMAAMNTADIGFEKEIWKAADKMRGNIDASEYKSVVLGLIFLKYISDKFEAKYQQLVAEGEGFEEDKDEYLSNKNEKVSKSNKKTEKTLSDCQLKVSIVLKSDALWAKAGHEVAWEQFCLQKGDLASADLINKGALQVKEDDNSLLISGRGFSVQWEKKVNGSMTSLIYKNKEMLAHSDDFPVQPVTQVFRAPTDNDKSFGNWLAKDWKLHGMDHPQEGWFEHDADKVWWGDFCKLCRLLLEKSNIRSDEIRCVGTSALGTDCLPVDKDCNPLRPAILYGIDSRAEEEIKWLTQYYGDDVKKMFGHPICTGDTATKILWLKNHEPEVYEKTYKFLTGSSYLTAKLTGKYVIDQFLAKGSFRPLYNRDGTINKENCSLYCRPDQIAECAYSFEIAGTVTEEAAKESGLKKGTPVIVGTGDSTAEAISVGLVESGTVFFQYGSSMFYYYCVDRYVDDYVSANGNGSLKGGKEFTIPGTFCIGDGTNAAGTLTRWVRDTFYEEELKKERAGGENAYAVMAREAAEVEAGSEGLIILPYIYGERSPIQDAKASGMLFGLKGTHTRKQINRAALEAVGYSTLQHMILFDEMNLPPKSVITAGGGTKNAAWMQIICDMIGRQICIPKRYQCSAYGDAAMAALGDRRFRDFTELRDSLPKGKILVPNEKNHIYYKEHYKMFRDLYLNNKDMMHRI